MRHYETSFFVDHKIVAETGGLSFRIRGPEKYSSPAVTIFFPDSDRQKYERIAAAINAIMSEPDAIESDGGTTFTSAQAAE